MKNRGAPAAAWVAVLTTCGLAACHDFGSAFSDYCAKSGDCSADGATQNSDASADGSTGTTDAGGRDGGSDAGLPTVQLTVVDHYLTGTGQVDVPWPAGNAAVGGVVAPLVLQAWIDGGSIPVYWNDGGSYAFYAQPGTPYLIGRQPPGYDHVLFAASSLGSLDLGEYVLGRPDLQYTGLDSTAFTVDAGGMVAWNDNTDVLEITSAGAGIGGNFLYIPNDNYPVSNPPANGDTHLEMDVSWGLFSTVGYPNLPIIDASKGDQTIIYQLAGTQNDAGLPYSRIAAAMTQFALPLTLKLGQDSLYEGAFTPVTPRYSGVFQYDRSQFAAITPSQPPNSVPTQAESVFVEATIGGTGYGRYAQMPDLAVCFIDAGTGMVNEALTFGDPFPSDWTLTYLAGQVSVTPYSVTLSDGTTLDTQDEADLTVTGVFDAGIILASPSVAPVTSPKVNGQIADSVPLSAVTTTPLIQWQPPAVLNPPTYYTVLVRQFVGSAGPQPIQSLLGIITRGTQVRIPPGFMTPGQTYAIRFNAVYDPNGGGAARPLVNGFPTGEAMSLTRSFSP